MHNRLVAMVIFFVFDGLRGVTMQSYLCSIMDKFGRSFETMTDNYDATTGVITREKSKLKVNELFLYPQYNVIVYTV